MNRRDLDQILSAAGRSEPLDPELLDRLRGRVLSSLTPVRALPPSAVFATAFLILSGAIAVAAAALAGIGGLLLLTQRECVAIFGVLGSIAVLASLATARNMRPGLRSVPAWAVFAAALTAIEGVFALLFHDYRLTGFVETGVPCLRAGVVCAIGAGVFIWLLVRQGFVVAPTSTGAVAGVLAGCAGLGMLELHCSIVMLPHVAVWHAGALVLSVAAGALLGRMARYQKPA